MPLIPSRVKYRKQQKGRMKGNAARGAKLDFGEYGLQVLEGGYISNNQIEACRVATVRTLKKKGKLWIRIFPDKPITKKPAETRMGKGKGAPTGWVAAVKPGRVILELGGLPESSARDAFRLAATKIALRARFIKREGL